MITVDSEGYALTFSDEENRIIVTLPEKKTTLTKWSKTSVKKWSTETTNNRKGWGEIADREFVILLHIIKLIFEP